MRAVNGKGNTVAVTGSLVVKESLGGGRISLRIRTVWGWSYFITLASGFQTRYCEAMEKAGRFVIYCLLVNSC